MGWGRGKGSREAHNQGSLGSFPQFNILSHHNLVLPLEVESHQCPYLVLLPTPLLVVVEDVVPEVVLQSL